jgi:hypothetical protein
MPCWLPFKGEAVIAEPYGIVIPNVAVRNDGEQPLSDQVYENARKMNETLYRQVSEKFDESSTVGVSRKCDSDIQSGEKRELYISETRKELNGDLAVSLTLVPDSRRFEVEIEIDIGSRERWNEAQELTDYYPFPGVLIGASLEVKDGVSDSSVAELLDPYINMLKAVADYARSDYGSTIATLKQILAVPKLPASLVQLALVMLGNSEGRQGKPGALKRAAMAFSKALDVNDSYPRAILGLAEIDYQHGIALIDAGKDEERCEGNPTKEALSLLDAAYQKYMTVFRQAGTSTVLDVDARAKYGTGRIQACRFLLGYAERSIDALTDLQYVTARFMSDPNKSWLRSSASGAFGDLALVFCGLGQRDKAIVSYRDALEWAVDEKRVREYHLGLDTIQANPRACL